MPLPPSSRGLSPGARDLGKPRGSTRSGSARRPAESRTRSASLSQEARPCWESSSRFLDRTRKGWSFPASGTAKNSSASGTATLDPLFIHGVRTPRGARGSLDGAPSSTRFVITRSRLRSETRVVRGSDRARSRRAACAPPTPRLRACRAGGLSTLSCLARAPMWTAVARGYSISTYAPPTRSQVLLSAARLVVFNAPLSAPAYAYDTTS
jgi:hypothetical protein